jgi:hypothetical protein
MGPRRITAVEPLGPIAQTNEGVFPKKGGAKPGKGEADQGKGKGHGQKVAKSAEYIEDSEEEDGEAEDTGGDEQETWEGNNNVGRGDGPGKGKGKQMIEVMEVDNAEGEGVHGSDGKGPDRGKDGSGEHHEGEGGERGIGAPSGEEGGEDEMEVEEDEGGHGGVSVEDQEAQRAILLLNKIDFCSPPVQLRFGMWNNSPVVTKHAQQLLAMMRKQGVRSFNPANRIPIIMNPGDISPTCVTMDTNLGPDVPQLVLTDMGNGKGYLEVAGGWHQYQAWNLGHEQAQKKIDKYSNQLDVLKDKEPKGAKALHTWDTNVAKLKEEICKEHVFIEAKSVWGVVVYNTSE